MLRRLMQVHLILPMKGNINALSITDHLTFTAKRVKIVFALNVAQNLINNINMTNLLSINKR